MESENIKPDILYVEDDQWRMQGVIDLLNEYYTVVHARSADQALEYLEDPNQKFKVIVLDIMMPPGTRIPDPQNGRTTGMELFRHLLKVPNLKDIPVVCYTVRDDLEKELTDLGVRSVITKDNDALVLRNNIEKVIKGA